MNSDYTTNLGTDSSEMVMRESVNAASAPQEAIDAITKTTLPNATLPPAPEPSKEEKEVTAGEVFKPARHVMELVTNTGERRAQPIRMPASAFFNINSIDRYASKENPTSQFAYILQTVQQQNANGASSYQMNSQRNLMSGYFHRLCVTDVNIQWNIPTINSQNYIFNLSIRNTSTTVVVSKNIALRAEYYTFTELATQLKEAIIFAFSSTVNAVPDFNVTWLDTATGSGYSYEFSTEDNDLQMFFGKELLTDASGNAINCLPGQSYTQAKRAMYKLYMMIGITAAWIGLSQITTVVIATPTYPTLIYTSYIDIISNRLSQFMRVKDSETTFQADTNVITRIYLTNQGMITSPTAVTKPIANTSGLVQGESIVLETLTQHDVYAVGSRPMILNYCPNTPKYIKWDPEQSIIDFDIRVIDEFGDIVPWSQFTQYSPPHTNQTYFTEFFEFQLTVLCSES
jgi:hypothetical protein